MQIKYDLDKVGIGSRLQEERIRAGHTQESLAEAMGITDQYISKVENGAAAPSLSYVMKFSDICCIIKIPKVADKNGESCISILEKIAG